MKAIYHKKNVVFKYTFNRRNVLLYKDMSMCGLTFSMLISALNCNTHTYDKK